MIFLRFWRILQYLCFNRKEKIKKKEAQNWYDIFMIFLWFWRILQYLCFYRKREKQKKRKNACMGLVQPTTKRAQLQGFNPGRKRSPPGEAHSDLDILHQEPDIFQKLLRPSHLFFLSSIFTSGTPYFFIFSSLLLISVGNETEIETEPVIGRGWGRKKKYDGNFAFLLLGIELSITDRK